MLDNCSTTRMANSRVSNSRSPADGVQNEVTAGAAMALYLQGGTFRDRVRRLTLTV